MKTNSYISDIEQIILSLRKLYSSYGYKRFVMSKFEEYELYSSYRDFLTSERILSFTDTDGSLKALKPDITLSLIKNIKNEDGLQKLYYNENVYRVEKNSDSFREINQLGLELIGDIDPYQISEVISLALKSLSGMSCSYVLDITDIDIIETLIELSSESPEIREEIRKLISSRNTDGLYELAEEDDENSIFIESIIRLLGLFGSVKDNMSELREILEEAGLKDLYMDFDEKTSLISRSRVQLDFSIISDSNYYNGIVFKGYIEEVNEEVLSGGEYRNLLQKMGKDMSGLGFAVYADRLTGLEDKDVKVDILAVYSEETDFARLKDKISRIREAGYSVFTTDTEDVDINYREILRF